jgi:hypothetical protein
MAPQSPLDRPFDTTFGLLRVRPAAKPVETGLQGCLVPRFLHTLYTRFSRDPCL